MIYLQLGDYHLWDLIVNGPYVPKTIIDGRTTIKPSKEWDENDKKVDSVGFKAMNILCCGLNVDQFKEYPCVRMQRDRVYLRGHL